MKILSLSCTALLAALLAMASSCGVPGYVAALPDLEKAGASALAYESKVAERSLDEQNASHDADLSLLATRLYAEACRTNDRFAVDTVRLLSGEDETLSGAVQLLKRHVTDARKRKLGKVVIPERVVDFGRESGARFLLVYSHSVTRREREDRYDNHHSESELELFLLDLQQRKVIYRGANKMSIDPALAENASAQFRVALQELYGF